MATTAIISDFGGVLTSPLHHAFRGFETRSGVPLEQLGIALGAILQRDGVHPIFELEVGRITEPECMRLIAAQLTEQLGRPIDMSDFSRELFEDLHPNEPMIEFMRALRDRGYKMAICTNNVREWEPLWRPKLPVDEIFELVIDSAFVGVRKPEPRIYELTLERLGVSADQALLLDDLELNCTAARELGLKAVWFRAPEQAIADIEAALAAD